MEGIADWLARITWPLVSRVLSSLGVGTVTFVGAESALGAALSHAKTAMAGLGGAAIQLIAISGMFDFMAITSGGIMSGLAWMVMKRFALQSTGGTA